MQVLESVDRLTQLVGHNRLEMLLFTLGNKELFGINVFKVREVVDCPPLRRFPYAHPLVAGLGRIRGVTVPVLDLARAIGRPSLTPSQARYVILTEFSRSVQGLLVSSIDRIINVSWDKVLAPSGGDGRSSHVTAITHADSGALVQVVDVERVLEMVVGPASGVSGLLAAESRSLLEPLGLKALVVDDSTVARNQIRRALSDISVSAAFCNDGVQALEQLRRWADEGVLDTQVSMVISDIEMPQMDGYSLVRAIRADARLKHLYVMMHSSLSGEFNQRACEQAGADRLLAKFDPDDFARAVTEYLAAGRS